MLCTSWEDLFFILLLSWASVVLTASFLDQLLSTKFATPATHRRLVDFKKLSAQTVEALMQWVPPPGVEMESSICTNHTGGNQLRRLQQRKAAKPAMA